MKKNEGNIFFKDIEMPGIVEDKIEEALFKIKMEETDDMRKKENTEIKRNYKTRKFFKPLLAIAACFILIVVGSFSRNFGSKNPNLSLTNNDDESDLQKDEKIKAPFLISPLRLTRQNLT